MVILVPIGTKSRNRDLSASTGLMPGVMRPPLPAGLAPHPVYFWPKLTSRLVEGSHQVAIFQIVLVVAIKRSQGDPGSAKSMQTDILTH